VPTLQLVNAGTEKSIAEKLDFFRNEVLAKLDPIDKKKQAADAAMNDMLDSAVGPDSFEVREVPIITTRVGMYIYLNAAVGFPHTFASRTS
jgi:mediator of RNA polymerase II transcription subunit 5